MIEEAHAQRLDQLIKQGLHLRQGNDIGQANNNRHSEECVGWIAAVMHLMSIISTAYKGSYFASAESIASNDRGFMIPTQVGDLTELLLHAQADIAAGLMQSLTNSISAEAFDDLLDHAESYLSNNSVEGASVLATAVLEDTVRKICKANDIEHKETTLDPMITELQKAHVVTSIVAKRLRSGAGVRNSALHARWEEISIDDIKMTIYLVRELITRHLQ